MDCRLVQRHLSAYVDGELEPTAMLELEEHLTRCDPCSLEWRFLGSLKRELKRQVVPAAAPRYLRERVESALMLVPSEIDEQPTSHVWWTIVSVAASVI